MMFISSYARNNMLSKHLFQSQANVKIRFCLPKITFGQMIDDLSNDLMIIIHFFMVLLCVFFHFIVEIFNHQSGE